MFNNDKARRNRLAQHNAGFAARFTECTAAPELCIDPFCDHTTGRVITLDVVAEPDVEGTGARTDDPSDAVRAEVSAAIARSEVAEYRATMRDSKRVERRVALLDGAERALYECENRTANLSRQLDEQAKLVDDMRRRLAAEDAWLSELSGLVHDAQRAADKACNRLRKLSGVL